MDVARYVEAFGLGAALRVGIGEWPGWESHFLVDGLVLVAEHERDARMIAQAAMWRTSPAPGSAPNG